LLAQVHKYIDSEIDYNQLEEWFVPRLPAYLSDPSSADADIIAVIELGLADLSAGLSNEDEFRRNLMLAILEHSTIILRYASDKNHRVFSASSNSSISLIAPALSNVSPVKAAKVALT
jgi:hypothetical protein